jgi:hypothetical protein
MSAPDEAYVISEAKGWEYIGEKVICPCGFYGDVDDLLGVDDDDMLWCPQCRTAAWTYK